MFIVGLLSWWYGAGWKARLVGLHNQLASSYDYFSIGLLLSSLFAPFRQISAGKVRGPIGVQLRAFFDRQISRVIGAIVRTILIISGIVWLSLQAVVGSIVIIMWAIVPILPFIGFVVMLAGWVPSWR